MRPRGAKALLVVMLAVLALPLAAAGIPADGIVRMQIVPDASATDAGRDLVEATGSDLPAAPLKKAPSAVLVTVDPVASPVDPGRAAGTTALVQYCYDTAGAVAASAPTTLHVKAHLRNWYDAVAVVVSPDTLTVEPVTGSGSSTWACAPERGVNVTVDPWYPFRDEVTVVVTATADENPPLVASEGQDAFDVQYARVPGDVGAGAQDGAAAHVQEAVADAANGTGVVSVAGLGLFIAASAGILFLARHD